MALTVAYNEPLAVLETSLRALSCTAVKHSGATANELVAAVPSSAASYCFALRGHNLPSQSAGAVSPHTSAVTTTCQQPTCVSAAT